MFVSPVSCVSRYKSTYKFQSKPTCLCQELIFWDWDFVQHEKVKNWLCQWKKQTNKQNKNCFNPTATGTRLLYNTDNCVPLLLRIWPEIQSFIALYAFGTMCGLFNFHNNSSMTNHRCKMYPFILKLQSRNMHSVVQEHWFIGPLLLWRLKYYRDWRKDFNTDSGSPQDH